MIKRGSDQKEEKKLLKNRKIFENANLIGFKFEFYTMFNCSKQ